MEGGGQRNGAESSASLDAPRASSGGCDARKDGQCGTRSGASAAASASAADGQHRVLHMSRSRPAPPLLVCRVQAPSPRKQSLLPEGMRPGTLWCNGVRPTLHGQPSLRRARGLPLLDWRMPSGTGSPPGAVAMLLVGEFVGTSHPRHGPGRHIGLPHLAPQRDRGLASGSGVAALICSLRRTAP